MTLGERISQKRKAAGLSQEALGEILGVSRQAIYKWESDQAVPELDKLIQLSRELEVPVGWLISEEAYPAGGGLSGAAGMGQTGAADSGQSAESEAFTAEDAEEMTRRVLQDYTAQLQKAEATRKLPRGYKWLAVLMAAALLIGAVQLRNLKQQYQNLYNYMGRMELRTQQEIGNISGNVQRVLEKYSDLTVSADVRIVSADYASNTVRIEISTKPKTYTQGMQAVFHLNYGEGMLDVTAAETADKSFDPTVDCPLTNEISVDVEFITGEISENKHLADFDGMYDVSFGLYFIKFSVEFEMFGGSLEKYCTVHYEPEKSYYMDEEQGPAKAAKLEMALYEDDRKIADYTYIDGVPEDVSVTGDFPEGQKTLYFRRPEGLKPDLSKHTYREILTVTDEHGRVLTVEGSSTEAYGW